jgi:hypothetical protein
VVYHLQSIAKKERLRLKARVPGDNPEIESACPFTARPTGMSARRSISSASVF